MPLNPPLATVLNEWLDARLNDVHIALPGKFKSYDSTTQTAEVIPAVKRSDLAADDSRTETALPVIPNVRVLWPRAGGFYIHFPIAAGDYCELLFNEASIAFFRTTGTFPASPGDLERHGLSHPYALPGGWPDQDAFTDAPTGHGVIVVAPGKFLRVTESGASGDFVALKAAVDAIQQNLDNLASFGTPWGPTAPGNLAPAGAQDSSTTLKA